MDTKNWFEMPDGNIETRWYTYENVNGEKGAGGQALFGRKGAACAPIAAGKTLTIADIKGSGMIRRIWATINPQEADVLRGLKLEIFWDGASTPAVAAPMSDFFCHSLGRMVRFENACFSAPEGKSFNCVIPMPFRKSAKIQLTNESEKNMSIYYEVDATVGDKHDDNMLYFHSYWRRENYTKLREDFTILPKVSGRGRFLGSNIGVRLHPTYNYFWWGEGEVKMYIDGDTDFPTLCGTGTEDYIGTGWGQGLYCNAFQGCHFIHTPEGAKRANGYGFYKFHIPDPVYFQKDARVTIQVMGGPQFRMMLEAMDNDPELKILRAGDGTSYFTREELEASPDSAHVVERIDDYCATAYWYMDKPENGLPELACAEERTKDLP